MKHLILMRGIPGSGKSTEAEILRGLSSFSSIVSADFHMYADGQEWSASRLVECHGRCFQSGQTFMASECPLVIVDNTNTLVSEVQVYYDLAVRYGYHFMVYQIHVNPHTAHARCRHSLPFDVVVRYARRMWCERLPAEWDVWTKGTPWKPQKEAPSPEDEIERARR